MGFYCFSTYVADTGKTKMTVDELGNLQLQYSRKLGIFQCDNWQVFSDGDAELAPGVPFVKVYDVDGDFHFAKRKETGSWINTGLHAAAWKAIGEAGIYKSADWVMKLDADAVFVPSRLVPILASKRVPKTGVYLEDLFAQQCLDSVGVPRIEAYDISTDGACEADRPEGEKKNKKFVPDCSTASTPQMHPYMTPKAMGACYDATIAAFGA